MVREAKEERQEIRYAIYEREKRELEKVPLTTKEYEQAIRRLAQKLKI